MVSRVSHLTPSGTAAKANSTRIAEKKSPRVPATTQMIDDGVELANPSQVAR